MNKQCFIKSGTLYPTLRVLLEEKDLIVTNLIVKGKVCKCYYHATAKVRTEFKEVIE